MLFSGIPLPVEGRRLRNEHTQARQRAKRRWAAFKQCKARNPELSFREFLTHPDYDAFQE